MTSYALALLLVGFLIGAATGLLTGCWLTGRKSAIWLERADTFYLFLFCISAAAFALFGLVVAG